jgi:hypothetical protein
MSGFAEQIGPYLPLTLVAPPPELHHFAKTGIAAGRPAADVVRRGARTPARARDKELVEASRAATLRVLARSAPFYSKIARASVPRFLRTFCGVDIAIDHLKVW